MIRQGHTVCAISTRGTGLSVPRPPRGGPNFYHQMDLHERFAWANLVLGTCVIGQRVWDILRTFDYLASRPEVDASQIRLIGQEEAGLAALMSAVLDSRARSLLLTGTVVSYMSIVESQDYSLPLAWFVPGILWHFDIPDLSAAIYPRPIWLLNTVDASGNPVSVAKVSKHYSQRIPLDSPVFKKIKIISTPAEGRAAYMDWLAHS